MKGWRFLLYTESSGAGSENEKVGAEWEESQVQQTATAKALGLTLRGTTYNFKCSKTNRQNYHNAFP